MKNSNIYGLKYRKRIKDKAYKILCGEKIACQKHSKWNCCGNELEKDYLTIDHINGGGTKHRLSVSSSGTKDHIRDLYLWIIKNQNEAKKMLQVLCMNAQFIKKKRSLRESGFLINPQE